MRGLLFELGARRRVFLDQYAPQVVTAGEVQLAVEWMRLAVLCASRGEWRATWDRVACVLDYLHGALSGAVELEGLDVDGLRREHAGMREELLGFVMGGA
jgi:hypothetical protein